MKFIFLLVFLQIVFLKTISSQNLPDSLLSYYTNVNTGFWDLYNKKELQGIERIEKIFKCTNAKPQDLKVYLRLLMNCKNVDSLITYWATFAIRNYGMRTVDLFDESHVDYYDSMLNYKENYSYFLLSHFDNQRDIFNMEHYFFNDTYLRTDLAQYKLPNNLEFGADALDFASQYDSLVIRPFLNAIINKYSFPTAQDLGFANIELFYFVLRHHNISESILLNALYSGKLHPKEYASLIDYSNMKKHIFNKMYGPSLTKNNGEFVLEKMNDYDNIDNRRKSIGLLPFYQESKVYKPSYKLNLEYIKHVGHQ